MAADPADEASTVTALPRVAWWAVAVFFLLYALAFIDRQILNLMVGPIRASLHVSDFQISLLQGLGFALFYTSFGIPIGWAVDRYPRRRIVFIGVIVWALAAAACGLASRYWHLLVGRIFVGAGEAALAPAAYSLLADMFPREKLTLPMSIMGTGAAVGAAAAAVITGLVIGWVPATGINLPVLGHAEGWQAALLITGVPGLLLAPIIFTVPETPRSRVLPGAKAPSLPPASNFLARNKRFYTGHFLGFGLYSLCNYGVTTWFATYLIRVRDWAPTTAAYAIGGFALAASIPGAICMGVLVDRWYASSRRDAHLRFFAFAAPLQAAVVVAAMATHSDWLMLALIFVQQFLASFTGVAAAALQIFTPWRMRGQVSAVYLLVFNLLGLGLGPVVVAGFTDFVFADDMMLGWGIAATFVIFTPLATALFLSAATAMRRDNRGAECE